MYKKYFVYSIIEHDHDRYNNDNHKRLWEDYENNEGNRNSQFNSF